MNTLSRSQRIVAALKELKQFQAVVSAGPAINVLTGVHVEPVADPLGIDHGRIRLTFAGAEGFDVSGEPYLEVQLIESVRLEMASTHGTHRETQRLHELREQIRAKYKL
ncbi:hypothetical protein BH09PSE5_BH09PSE5_00890 [soil metagenome]